jgi:hypothetical protein
VVAFLKKSSAKDFCYLDTGCFNVSRQHGAKVILPPGGPVLFFQEKQFILGQSPCRS